MSGFTSLPSYSAIQEHFTQIKDKHLRDFFAEDTERAQKLSLQAGDLFLDYSKNRIDRKTIPLLLHLAEESQLKEKITALFKGQRINTTENRSVLHIALRNTSDAQIVVEGKNVMPDVRLELAKMAVFAHKLRNKEWQGYSGKPVKNIINIGIGGSDLGPAMATQALAAYADPNLTVRFISNVDESQFIETVKDLNPEETLFIISSKTFTTIETMTNAKTAKDWIVNHFQDIIATRSHFVAVSTNLEGVANFGIDPQNTFQFWDWVGGRYSLCSAIGLSLMVAIGPDNFEKMLSGFHTMDEHFKTADFEKNMPVILGLLSVWYNNFFLSQTHAVLPYDQYLEKLPRYLQQLEMESNGKSVQKDGLPIDYQTAPIIWGEPGTNGQHAFYQLLHQGTKLIPSDFIGFVEPIHALGTHHTILLSNLLAQTQVLAFGKTADELTVEGTPVALVPHKLMHGNQPSNTLLAQKLTPEIFGQLIALYEHKTFVEGVIWNINSFDQFGVELGKVMAKNVMASLEQATEVSDYDSSTNSLLNFIRERRG